MEAARPHNASSYRYGSSKASERVLIQVWKQQGFRTLPYAGMEAAGLRTPPHAGMEAARPQNASTRRYGNSKTSERFLTQVWKQQGLRSRPHAGMEAAGPQNASSRRYGSSKASRRQTRHERERSESAFEKQYQNIMYRSTHLRTQATKAKPPISINMKMLTKAYPRCDTQKMNKTLRSQSLELIRQPPNI